MLKRITFITIGLWGLAVFFLVTVYMLVFKPTSESYSLTRKWKEYYSMEDWNLPMHAVVDVDNDGNKDIITTPTNCAFLSSVTAEMIPSDKQCEEPGSSYAVFAGNKKTGQKIMPQKPFKYQWLKKSYLVKNNEGVWRFYDMNGWQLRVYELGKNRLFEEIKPGFLDRIDVLVYQVSHLGVVAVMFLLTPRVK